MLDEAGVPTPEVVPTQTTVNVDLATPAPKKKAGRPKLDLSDLLEPGETAESVPQRTLVNRKFHAKVRDKKDKKLAHWNSESEPTDKEALELLKERVANPHVRKTCLRLGRDAARHLGLVANEFFWQHGATQAAESQRLRKAVPLEIKHDEEVNGETIFRGDLYFLWDMGISWREKLTFEEYLQTRNLCKTDAFELGLILGKDFHDQPHKNWRNFYPIIDPSGLKPGYTQEQVKAWWASQSPIKDRMLLASRNAYKSSFNIVWAVCATINCADLRLLFCSETTKLSKGFIRAFRNYFETNERNPTRFQQLFAEHTIPAGDGSSLNFESPMRTLNLIQFTAEATSFESSVAGQRADVIVFDDPISDKSTGTDEMCEKGVLTFAAIQKLREVGGYSLIAGTPWRAELDLYAVLIRNTTNDSVSDENEKMQIRIDPAWTVRSHARGKHILHLVEDDVDLLFPSRLTWKFLQKELRSGAGNTSFFRMQNLCEFVSDDDQIKVTFTLEQLQAAVRHSPPEGQRLLRVCSLDSAFSAARTADFSCLVTADLIRQRSREEKDLIFVHDVKLERLKTSELGTLVAETLNRLKPDRVIAERTGDWVSLQDAIRRAAVIRGYILPDIFWKPVSNVAGAALSVKAARAKGMEPMIADGRLLFSSGIPTLENCFAQMCHFDGIKRSGSSPGSKDDFVDSMSLLVQTWGPRTIIEPKSEAQEEYEASMERQRLIQMQHAAIFGTPQSPQQQVYVTPSENSSDDNKLFGMLSRYGFTRRGT